MAPTKKAGASPKARSSTSKISLKRVKGENFYRDAKSASRVKMLNGGKPVYDRDGKIKEAAAFQKTEAETEAGRVQPDRRWFGNTRVISQTALDHFRTSLGARAHDPYSVLLKRNKLPMSLLDDALNPNSQKRPHIVETEPFGDTFGPKAQRKRPRLDVGSIEELGQVGAAHDAPEASTSALPLSEENTHADFIEPIYSKGTSRRIYGELYKVIDSSDVILHILDARDPLGTICTSVLEYIKKEKSHKQVVLIINKCDLVPNWVTDPMALPRAVHHGVLLRPWKIDPVDMSPTSAPRHEDLGIMEAGFRTCCKSRPDSWRKPARYIQHLTPQYPTIAFHASPNHSFGKGSLIQLLRQFSQLHSDKKQISVGFIGYPNVGKSSVINTLKSGKVCRVAPIPGETKVWQYITLTRRIYLIDCPGIVPTSAHDSNTSTVLKGVLRVEALPVPSEHIAPLLERVKPLYISRTYGIPLPEDGSPYRADQLLDQLARMKGRLLKGGEPDLEGVSKIILSDWVRGRIPFFVPPPERSDELNAKEAEQKRRAEIKGKAKASGTDGPLVPGVTQKLSGIIQKNTFVGEDARRFEEPEEAPDDNQEHENDEDEGSDVKKGSDEDEAVSAEELVWSDVYPESDEEKEAPKSDKKRKKREVDNNEEESKPAKEARMKTNKRKATNFFTNANVKNKNRNKAKLLEKLKGTKGRHSTEKSR
ncbi:NGP1NT-domain-containing protein [Sistotremastrum suecicum HHB10207 ss-3]|uniref:Nucleolar GTP-binding protein 2 n=1 Tax=Sistotremastrum suecicum HHB10207 ss-3 TaxID=1314776 RepID=A0A166HE04_9AGAM|nr:NGP1NT-domain-containing protein [Sistotremastrum suecicum HHB10207 ss-3]